MVNPHPLVSVVIPAFNSGTYIRETIASVLQQDYEKLEVIVADDGSSDTTAEVVKVIAAEDSRVRLLELEHAGRPSVPRNRGAEAAKGELLAFLDSDDLWVRNKLSTQVRYLLEHHAVHATYSASVTFGAASVFSPEYEVLPLPWKAARIQQELCTIGNTIPCSSVIMEKELFDELGGFNEAPSLKAVEDYEFWLRLTGRTPFGFIPRIQVLYRVHQSQVSGDWRIKAERLDAVRKISGLPVPPYKMGRTKGPLIRFVRSLLHLSATGYYRFRSVIAD